MKIEDRQYNIGIVVPSITDAGDIALSRFLKVLHPISGRVYVVAGSATPKNYDWVRVFTVGYERKANIVSRAINYVHLQFGISHRLAKLSKNADLWFFSWGGEALLLPVLTAKVMKRKVVLALAGYLEKEGEAKHDVLYKPLALAKKVNCALSDQIVVYSKRLIEEWNLEKYRDKISIAPSHFLDFDKFRIQKPLGKRHNLIGYIGRLSEEKGISNFVEAIPEILENQADAEILIGGDGELHTKVEQYLSDQNLNSRRAKFVGWISHDKLPEYLNNLKLLVLPSYIEGLPHSVLEALACGTPVLATPVGAIPDMIKDGETGFIMEDNSPECIARNVIRALNHPNLEEIGKTARALVEKEFTYEVAVKKYENVLQNLTR